jgi:predicted metallopeptidase
MKQELIEVYEKTIPVENINMIPLNFVCEFFSLDYDRQYRNLDNDDSFNDDFKKVSNFSVFNDNRQRGHLTKKGFIKWILQLNPTYINELLQPTFKEYQNNVISYLYDNAFKQEQVLKRIVTLKRRKEQLYDSLYATNDDFVEFVNTQAEIMRLGKENKIIQDKIAGNQILINFD